MPTLIRQAPRARINIEGFVPPIRQEHNAWNRLDDMSIQRVQDEAPHVLVVDDDDRIRTLLQRYLSDQGLRVSTARDAQNARHVMQTLAFDLLIVDIMMPGEDGLSLTKSVRATSDVPILMLTARSETADRITGLEVGADDYLPKPFEPKELLLRINNILRRNGPPPSATIEVVRFGPFTYNLERGELLRDERVVRLTDREKEMLRIFCLATAETVPRHELLPDPDGTGERTVDVQINRLRRKIEDDPSNPIYLHTVRGIGYRLLTD